MPALNAAAPDFTLKNTRFEDVSLSGLKGQKVVLAFYPAAFTGVCQAELCAFQDRLAQLNDLNAVVLGISSDSPYANGVFAENNGINFDLLSDPTRDTINAYGVAFPNFSGVPGFTASQRAVFVVGTDGALTYAQTCEHPGLEPDYEALIAALSA